MLSRSCEFAFLYSELPPEKLLAKHLRQTIKKLKYSTFIQFLLITIL
jgi:hypothetical protein